MERDIQGKPHIIEGAKDGDIDKRCPDMKVPSIGLRRGSFDELYAELQSNLLPDKVYGEWEL